MRASTLSRCEPPRRNEDEVLRAEPGEVRLRHRAMQLQGGRVENGWRGNLVVGERLAGERIVDYGEEREKTPLRSRRWARWPISC